jgi:hypothetical protein
MADWLPVMYSTRKNCRLRLRFRACMIISLGARRALKDLEQKGDGGVEFKVHAISW